MFHSYPSSPSVVNLYPHRIVSVIGRSSPMPIQTLSTSFDGNFLIGSSTTQETLQLIDCQQLKLSLNSKKKKSGSRSKNSFFDDLESTEQTEPDDEEQKSSDDDDDDDDDDSDDDEEEEDDEEESVRPPKKKQRKNDA